MTAGHSRVPVSSPVFLVALLSTPKGRPRSIDADKISELMGSGMGATAVGQEAGHWKSPCLPCSAKKMP